ncbi:folate-binding protein [Luteimonas sp. 50]|uniref:Folate-binding protein n=2 Tax=Cognatiluteimonas sedimenti TaxID=2927791 RepID=A0ABT0A0Y5_9GAMM|nr:folate-binding protein [Lysobacter sedimenti]MCJ0824644.1 folate-binding protein [Lysobacter sedimenti]
MNDVAGLAPGHWQWNGWLTPKGRLLALFALLKLDEQTLWLLLPDADPVALAAQLQRYVFRSKVAFAVRDDLCVAGAFAAPVRASQSGIDGGAEHGLELDFGGEGGPRTLRIDTHVANADDADFATRWTAFDLEHGLPRLGDTQAGQWTPQQLSLDRLQAYSVKKGCYPGQEIVARTHFLGQAKRGLALLDADGPLLVGSEVGDGERALGTIVSSVGGLALAVLPLERNPAATLAVAGVAVRERALRDGLARA